MCNAELVAPVMNDYFPAWGETDLEIHKQKEAIRLGATKDALEMSVRDNRISHEDAKGQLDQINARIPIVQQEIAAIRAQKKADPGWLEKIKSAVLPGERKPAVPELLNPNTPPASPNSAAAPEGTIINGASGRMIKRGGKWVPL